MKDNNLKSFTSLEQSRILEGILPPESADMAYVASATDDEGEPLYTADYKSEFIIKESDDCVNCWSLAALINALPKQLEDGYFWLQIDYLYHAVSYLGKNESVLHYILLNNKQLVDAVYEMIIWLEQYKKMREEK